MEINWEIFSDIISDVLDTVDEIQRLVNNTDNKPCLLKAIKLIDDSYFITGRFSTLFERYSAEGAASNADEYRQKFNELRDTAFKLFKDKRYRIEGFEFEGNSTGSVEEQCNRLLDASISPFDPNWVKEFEGNELISPTSFVKTEATLTFRKLLSWSDGNYFERLNAYGLLKDTKDRHPLEKFLMSLLEEIETFDADINGVKKINTHRFVTLVSFIYYFSERSQAVLRVPLQDTLTVAEVVQQYATLVLGVAKTVGFPREKSLVIETRLERNRRWFADNPCFAALHEISIQQVAKGDLESPELGDFYISNTPESMESFIKMVSVLLQGCYPTLSKVEEIDEREHELRVSRYEIYRASYFDVASQLKDQMLTIKSKLGNSGSGLIKQYSIVRAEREKLDVANAVIKGLASQREKLSGSGQQHITPILRPPTPNSGNLANRKSGGNSGLRDNVTSKSGVLPRRSPLAVSPSVATGEKARSRSSGDDQSPRSTNSLQQSAQKESPVVAPEPKKASFFSFLSGKKKAEPTDKRRGSEATVRISEPEEAFSPRSKSATTTPRDAAEGSKDDLSQPELASTDAAMK